MCLSARIRPLQLDALRFAERLSKLRKRQSAALTNELFCIVDALSAQLIAVPAGSRKDLLQHIIRRCLFLQTLTDRLRKRRIQIIQRTIHIKYDKYTHSITGSIIARFPHKEKRAFEKALFMPLPSAS